MSAEVDRAVRAHFRQAREQAAMEELEAELMKYWGLLEQVGLAVVRARNGEEIEDGLVRVPGIMVHGVSLYVKADEVAAAQATNEETH